MDSPIKPTTSKPKTVAKYLVVSTGVGFYRVARILITGGNVGGNDVVDAVGITLVSFVLFVLVFVVFSGTRSPDR